MTSREEQDVRYWPTTVTYTAHLDRGPCGHILCAYAERCALPQLSGPERAPGVAAARGKTRAANPTGSEPTSSGPEPDSISNAAMTTSDMAAPAAVRLSTTSEPQEAS